MWKVVFHKIYLVHPWIFCLIRSFTHPTLIKKEILCRCHIQTFFGRAVFLNWCVDGLVTPEILQWWKVRIQKCSIFAAICEIYLLFERFVSEVFVDYFFTFYKKYVWEKMLKKKFFEHIFLVPIPFENSTKTKLDSALHAPAS